ncbi:Arm DNA-binding domain-containing protein [uncultured Stenotrophomonas sp.]|uniref:Arm DNA-binding domain-containing protein n=1 Tax=uncultured Stenotrophomonas sp. TaxID=165438 RepID=UPI0025DC8512|nr:Arm DNA-binding domain-containing protein [uncultured Stenotrophomonas sp.]
MRVQLTKRQVETYQPQERPYEVRDAQVRGLILRVQPSGHKAWIVSWAHGKRRTIGPTTAIPLDLARAQATHAIAEYLQSGLPRIGQGKSHAPTLQDFIDQRYRAWATLELKRGHMYANLLEQVFAEHLDDPLTGFNTAWADQWLQLRLSTPTGKTKSPPTRSTAARDLACLRAALSKAVSWGLIATNPLFGMRIKGGQSRKVVRYLSLDEEARLRTVMAARDRHMIAARVSGNRWRALRQEDLYPAESLQVTPSMSCRIYARFFACNLAPLPSLHTDDGITGLGSAVTTQSHISCSTQRPHAHKVVRLTPKRRRYACK